MPRRILVVDDEPYVTQLLAFLLRRAGDEVFIADNGERACAAAPEILPDLVITDYQMPVLDGLDLCRRLKADPRTCETPVLFLTARGHRIKPEEIAGTNVRCLLAKPFSPRELMGKVRDLLGPPSPDEPVAATTVPLEDARAKVA